MPECNNCGGFVTDQYARVFAPSEIHGVRVCPNRKNKLRSGGEGPEGAIAPAHQWLN